MNKRVSYISGDNLFVVTLGRTTNAKIADPKQLIVQTYTYSLGQLKAGQDKVSQGDFFAQDQSNCLDCPLSGNSGTGKCYTHKYMQFSGFLSQLRSVGVSNIGGLDEAKRSAIVDMCRGRYVRFGTYGEPSLMPVDLVSAMVDVSRSHTGYTHQWDKVWAQDYAPFFMASVHNQGEELEAKAMGWRSFITVDKGQESDAVQCPASKEAGFKATCASCNLCSGRRVKTLKNIKINKH